MTEDDVRRVLADGLDSDECWERITDEPDVRCVEAVKTADADPWVWSVTVSAMEFVRDDPLESDLREGVSRALRSVRGVADVAEEDREVWIVGGSASGQDRVRACASVVDEFADRIRSYVSGL